MTLIRTQAQNGLPCITESHPLVINAAHVVLYEPSNRLYWATESQYEEDKESNRTISEYKHAKQCTRVVFVTGKEYHVLQTFESFDRTFKSMTTGR